MVDERTADLVRQAHSGELLGSALFEHLAEEESVPERRATLRAAQLLEEQTAEAAADLARDLGVPCSDGIDERTAARAAADALGAMPWSDRLDAIAQATGGYRELYAALGSCPDAAAHPAVATLVAHEQALHAFAEAEANGVPGAVDLLTDALLPEYRERLTTS